MPLAIAQNQRDTDMIELLEKKDENDPKYVWGIFHRDALYQEPEETYEEISLIALEQEHEYT
jgi:hypothetical protein